MAMAAMAISAVVGLVGSFMQASALNAQAKAQENIANFNARQQEIEGQRRAGVAAVRGELEMKEAQSLAGKARAGFAEMGIDTSQGSPLLLEQDLISEGAFRQNIEVAEGKNEERSLFESAKGERYEGKIRAAASRSQARASILGGIGSAFGTLGKVAFG
jgi:hypothetical protein